MKTKPVRDYTTYQRMEAIRRSGAAGIHADQNRRRDPKAIRRATKREERDLRNATTSR